MVRMHKAFIVQVFFYDSVLAIPGHWIQYFQTRRFYGIRLQVFVNSVTIRFLDPEI